MSVWIKGNKKASRLFIGGKDIAKAYYNGNLIFSKGNISFGILTYNDPTTGSSMTQEITEASDFNLLFDTSHYRSGSRSISFSFKTMTSYHITGWEWNTYDGSAVLYANNTINAGFLANCPNLNSDIAIPDWITTIQDDFLFTSSNIIAGGTIPKFNGVVTFGKNLTAIGNYFLNSCNRLNKPINTNKVKTIGSYFFCPQTGYGDTSTFNNTVSLPNVETIGAEFMNGHILFNNTFDIGTKITSIGNYFLAGCTAFNKFITLPSTLTNIGTYFLNKCYAFNKSLTIPANCTVGAYLLTGSRFSSDQNGMSFAQTLTLSAGCSIGGALLSFLRNTISPTIVCNTEVSNITTSTYSFLFNTSVPYPTGRFLVSGTYANELLAAFPNGSYNYGVREMTLA